MVAFAAGASRFPWRAIARGLETVIEHAATGRAVACFPAALDHLATSPTGRAWAGSVGNHLHLITLEGSPKTPKTEDTAPP